MSRLFVDNDLWAKVEPMLPDHSPSRKGGQPRKSDRVCLSGIMFVLKTGIPWEDFPQEMGCCGMTLWNRLHEWQQAGVWPKIHRLLSARLEEARPYRLAPRRTVKRPDERTWNGEETGVDRRSSRTRATKSLSLEHAESRDDSNGRRSPSARRVTHPFIQQDSENQRKRVG